MKKDTKLIKQVLDNLQKLNEKKKNVGMRSVKKGADNNPKTTKMDFLPNKVLDKIAKEKGIKEGDTNRLICPNCGTHNEEGIDKCRNCGHPYPDKKDGKKWEEAASETLDSVLESFVNLDEKRKRKRKNKKKTDFDIGGQPQYRSGRSQKQIKRQSNLTRRYNAATTEKQRQKIRDMIDKSREKEGVNENMLITKYQLSELISEALEAEKLAIMLEKIEELEEKKKRKKKKKKGGGLSAAVKKSLDKKADRRGLTRGSVYTEFRKGLAAYYSSGSRKGMSAHQWAHARVNSANPSKSWASVKKRKGGKKKKK